MCHRVNATARCIEKQAHPVGSVHQTRKLQTTHQAHSTDGAATAVWAVNCDRQAD